MIDALGLSGFFLLHRDMLELAREVAVEVRGPDTARALLPPGRGRGSSVSSIVCYLTGLSHVDPIENELFLGRFLNEELTALPDIDLDFPRDIREVLIPRVHERYGRERSALVAAFPTYRARGAIRELGKALGLPPGEIERVARGVGGLVGARRRRAGHRARRSGEGARGPSALGRWRWLARLSRRGPRAAAPPLPALGRDDRRDPPADRLLPGRAGGDGGPPDGAVGQGLLRRRGLPEDRPARAGDALGGRALRRADRARARRARSTSRGSPTTTRQTYEAIQRGRDDRASSRSRAARRCSRCGARGRRPSTTSRSRSRSCGRGRSRAARSTRTSSAARRLRADPDFEVPYEHPSLEPVLRDTLGTIIFQDQVIEVAHGVRRLLARRGRGAAPGDEPQALGGGDRGLPPSASSRARMRAHGASTRSRPSGSGTMIVGLLGLRLPQGPRRGVRPARLPVDLAARALRPGVPVRAAQRAADGLLPAGRARPRGPAARASRSCRRTSTRSGGRSARSTAGAAAVRLGLGLRARACAADEVAALVAERERGGPVPLAGDLASRAGAGRAGARAARLVGRVRRAGRRERRDARRDARCGSSGVAAPGVRPAGTGTQLALPLELPAAPRAARAGALGARCSPTTRPPG